ncbi:MAG TPA: hypothetical protein VK145_02780 [Candidatus Nanoarchaeia archaeon]|nr:hypothetical protein [Candidatus Nanoarchaeia archaeon]
MKLNELSNKYGDDVLAKVFPNVRALTGTLSLLGDRLKDNIGIFDRVKNSSGDMDKAFEAATQTLQYKWNQALAGSKAAMIELTDAFKATLIPIFEKLSSVFSGLAKWVDSLTDTEKKLLFYTLAVAAAVGPFAIGLTVAARVLSVVISVVKALTVEFTLLTAAMKANPWGWAAMGVTLLISGLTILYKNYQDNRRASESYEDSLKKLGGTQADFYKNIVGETQKISTLFDMLKKTNEGTKTRKALIDTINQSYGSYLSNLLSEKSTLQDIEKAQRQANAAARDAVAEKFKNEKINAILEQQIKREQELLGKFATEEMPMDMWAAQLEDFGKKYITTISEINGKQVKNTVHIGDMESSKQMDEFIEKTKTSSREVIGTFDKIIKMRQKDNAEIESTIKLYDKYATVAKKTPTQVKTPTSSLDIKAFEAVEKAMNDLAAGEKYIAIMTEVMGDAFDATTAKINLYKNVLEQLVKAGQDASSKTVQIVIEKLKGVDTVAATIKKVSRDLTEELTTIDNVVEATGGTFTKTEQYLDAYTKALEKLGRKGITSGEVVEAYKKEVAALNKEIMNTGPLIQYGKDMDWIVKQKDIYGAAFDGVSASIDAQMRLLEAYTSDTIPDAEQGVKELTEDLKKMLEPMKKVNELKQWAGVVGELASSLNGLASAAGGNEAIEMMANMAGGVQTVISSMARLKEINEQVKAGLITTAQAATAAWAAMLGIIGVVVMALSAIVKVLNQILEKPRKVTALEIFNKQLDLSIDKLKFIKGIMDSGLAGGKNYGGDVTAELARAEEKVKSTFGTTDLDALAKYREEVKGVLGQLNEWKDGAENKTMKRIWEDEIKKYEAVAGLIDNYVELQKMSKEYTDEQIEKEKELAQARIDALEAAQEALNKQTFTDPGSMSAAIVDAFTSGMQEAVDKGIKPMFDFAKSIKDILRNAIIQSMSLVVLEPAMKKLQQAIAKDMQGNVTEMENNIKANQKLIEQFNQMKVGADAASAAFLDNLIAQSNAIIEANKQNTDQPGIQNSDKFIKEFVDEANKYAKAVDDALATAGLGFESSVFKPGDAGWVDQDFLDMKARVSDAFSSGIEEGLKNGEPFAEVYGKTFKDIIKNELISAMSVKLLKPMLDDLAGNVGSLINNPYNTTEKGFNQNVLPYIQKEYGADSDFAKKFKTNYDLIQKAIASLQETVTETIPNEIMEAFASSVSNGIAQGLADGKSFTETWNTSLKDSLKKALIDAMSAKMLQPMIDKMTKRVTDLTGDQRLLQTGGSGLAQQVMKEFGQGSAFAKEFQANYEYIRKAISTLQDGAEEVTSKIQTDFASAISSGIEAGMKNGTPFAQAFANTFNDALKNAIIATMSAKLLQPMIDAMSKDVAATLESPEFMRSGANQAGVVQSMIKNKYGAGSDFYKKFQSNYEAIQQVVNSVSLPGTEQKGMEGAIKGVTEETAGLIAGQFNALRVTALKIEKNTAETASNTREIKEYMKRQTSGNIMRENGW